MRMFNRLLTGAVIAVLLSAVATSAAKPDKAKQQTSGKADAKAAVDRAADQTKERPKELDEQEKAKKDTATPASPGKLTFKIAGMKGKRSAEFKQWHFSKVSVPEDDVTRLTATLVVDLASLKTDDKELTAQLLSSDYLDVKNNAKATVTIKNVIPAEDLESSTSSQDAKGRDKKTTALKHYTADGEITIGDEKQELDIDLTVLKEKPLKLHATTVIDRGELGIGGEADEPVAVKVPMEFEALVVPGVFMKEEEKKALEKAEKAGAESDAAKTKAGESKKIPQKQERTPKEERVPKKK